MGKPVQITPFLQHLINQVRIRRLERGISQRELSLIISNSESLVGNVENPNDTHKYSGQQLELIADALGCKVEDFYPENILEDDILQEKYKIIVDKRMGPAAILNSLLEAGYFKSDHNLKAITDYANTLSQTNRKTTDFSSTVARFIESGRLVRVESPDSDSVSYRQP